MILITNVLFLGIKTRSNEPKTGIINKIVIKLLKNNINFNMKNHLIGFEPMTVSLEGYCSIQTELKINQKCLFNKI